MNNVAPEGQVFVCAACGKRSKDKYGDQMIDRGWDVSCMMNSVLCYEEKAENGLYVLVFDLPMDGRLDDAGRRSLPKARLNAEAQEARKPLTPEQLVGALQDRAHHEVGTARPARTIKTKK